MNSLWDSLAPPPIHTHLFFYAILFSLTPYRHWNNSQKTKNKISEVAYSLYRSVRKSLLISCPCINFLLPGKGGRERFPDFWERASLFSPLCSWAAPLIGRITVVCRVLWSFAWWKWNLRSKSHFSSNYSWCKVWLWENRSFVRFKLKN